MLVRYFTETDRNNWDAFVRTHPDATHCHLSGWKTIFEETYRHQSFYLVAEEENKIRGILPLFYIKSHLFGTSLVSMPFLSYGGILSHSQEAANALLNKALELKNETGAETLELRYLRSNYSTLFSNLNFMESKEKVTLLRELPESSEELFSSFKSKLRSQIRRPIKEGMTFTIGGEELLDEFYQVFAVNMRDLGSPVHDKELFIQIFKHLPENARIGIVYYQNLAIAGGVIVEFCKTVEIPWASALKEYNRLSPNMLLYWSLLEYSCNRKNRIFDFGRSTPDEGTYHFKKQWGAEPYSLHWQVLSDTNGYSTSLTKSKKMEIAVSLWKKLPVSVANYAGPKIRKSISL